MTGTKTQLLAQKRLAISVAGSDKQRLKAAARLQLDWGFKNRWKSMKTSNSSACKGGVELVGLILLTVAVGAGSARAETFRHGGSTATIEQSGGGTSRSEVTRYQDGQKIVTQDGNSRDITIQGGSGSPAPDYGWGYSEWGNDRFDRQRTEERFSRGADDYPESTVSSERDVFKQQMLDRMGNRFRP